MDELGHYYNDDTIETFDNDALRQCALLAELIHEGIIPKNRLVKLGEYLDAERPWFVTTALESIKARE